MDPVHPLPESADERRIAWPADLTPARYHYVEVPAPEVAAAGSPASWLQYVRIVRAHIGLIILVTFFGIAGGILLTIPQTRIYQSMTSIEIQGFNENLFDKNRMEPLSSGSSFGIEYDIQTQMKILQSGAMRERAVAKLKQENRPDRLVPAGRFAAWAKVLRLPNMGKTVSWRDRAIGIAASHLMVQNDGQTRIVQITTDSTDPEVAADFVNTLVSEFSQEALESRWKTTQHTSEWLTRQLQDLKIKLEASEDQMQAYARASGLMFFAEKDNVAEEKLKQVQSELSKAQADRVVKQLKYEMAASSPLDSLPEILDDPNLRAYQTKLAELKRQLAEADVTYTPSHVKVKRLQAQVAELQGQMEKERADVLRRIKSEYNGALRREQLMGNDYNGSAKTITEQSAKVIHYNILKREVDSSRQLYEALLQKVKEYGIASAMVASNVRVVDPAKPALLPYKPNMMWNGLMGLMAGLALGVTIVIMRDRVDRAIHEPGDAPLYLNRTELGVIPAAEGEVKSKRKENTLMLQAKKEGDVEALNERLELVTWQRKYSLLAESFRATLTSVLFSSRNGHHPRTIVLSSPGPSEGKTTVISNLAVAMAETHRRVLLIDADMRKPRLHTVFDVDNNWGLSDLLVPGQMVNDFATSDMIVDTGVPGLSLLPSGTLHTSISHLLYSTRLTELLARFRREYDMVLIDTPPMLHISDARVLARHSDGVILVLRSGKTTRDAALSATQRLTEDGTPVLGTILNDWNPKRSATYGYSKYYGSYASYYGDPDGSGSGKNGHKSRKEKS